MNKHKTKFFKKIFATNSDDSYRTNGPTLFVMTEETFVPLMGQMWDKAKTRYKKRYKQKPLEFTDWLVNQIAQGNIRLHQWGPPSNEYRFINTNKAYKINELYEWWKENIKGKE